MKKGISAASHHDANYWKHFEYLDLFPLSQFKLKNPCTKCLVRPACEKACDDYYKYGDLRIMLHQRLNYLINLLYIFWGYVQHVILIIFYTIGSLIIGVFAFASFLFIMFASLFVIVSIYKLWAGIL